MKKILFILFISVIGYACGNEDTNNKAAADSSAQKTTTPEPAPAAAQDVTENPDYQKGIELIAKSDCLTCHKVDEKFVGPAYREYLAKKYHNGYKIPSLKV